MSFTLLTVRFLVALYLPPHAVAVQLVPYGKVVNFDEFGALLAARGPYVEWHNPRKVHLTCAFCRRKIEIMVVIQQLWS